MFLLVPAHPGSPGERAVERLCVCVCVCNVDHFVVCSEFVALLSYNNNSNGSTPCF